MSLTLKKIADDEEIPEPLSEEVPEEEAEEEVPEYIGLTPEGLAVLKELQDASEEERISQPGLYESLSFLQQFNRAADAVGHPPMRSQEELLEWFAEAGLSPDSFWYAAGKNPTNTRYVSWFKDRPGEFAPTKAPRQNIVQDKQHYVRNLLSKNPLSARDMEKLTDEETAFLDNLRKTDAGPPVGIQDIQKELVGMLRNFQKLEKPVLDHYIERNESPEDRAIGENLYKEELAKYNEQYTDSLHAYEILDMYTKGELKAPLDPTDKKFLEGIRHRLEEKRAPQKSPFNRQLSQMLHDMAYPPKDEPELWEEPESVMARNIVEKGIVPDPASGYAIRHDVDPRKLPFFFHGGEPFPSRFWEERENWMPAKKRWTREIDSSTLRLEKKSDTTGPGGPDWTYEFTSGPTPTKDEKERRKHRFPFHNKPSGDLAVNMGGEQGNIINSKPGVENMDSLEATINGMLKTADNDLFETQSFESGEGPWMSFTIFKRAYSKFKKGDVVVQYGKSISSIQTLRRRFGTLMAVRRNFRDVVGTVFAILNPQTKEGVTTPGTSTPDDSMHEIQTGPFKGPYKKRPDYDHPERGPREGFTRPVNRRDEDTKRNVLPFEDQEVSNQTSIFGNAETLNLQKTAEVGNYAAPVVETPEERAGMIEQDVPKPINWDPKRPFPNKRKRVDDINENTLLDKPTYQRHDRPLQNLSDLRSKRKITSAVTFDDLVFKPHPHINNGMMSRMNFPNGFAASVIAMPIDNDLDKAGENFEVGVFYNGLLSDNVYQHLSPQEVTDILQRLETEKEEIIEENYSGPDVEDYHEDYDDFRL